MTTSHLVLSPAGAEEARWAVWGPQEGGAPCKSRQHGFWCPEWHALHWWLHASHELALQSTGATCSCQRVHSGALASRTSDLTPCKRMHHAWVARRRPGLGWSLSGGSFGGEGSLSTLCLSTLSEPTFPVDSASGAKLLQIWSATLAAISTSTAVQSCAPARLSAWLDDYAFLQAWSS